MNYIYIKMSIAVRGGDISGISEFNNILSIGYEVECGILMKLTKTEGNSDSEDKIVLFNSDTARKDILEFKKFDENPEDMDDDIVLRLEETVEDTMYDDSGNIDDNSIFNITNDIAMSPFIKKIGKVCYYSSDESNKSDTDTDTDDEDADYTDEKNELYLFRDNEGNDYTINFLFSNKNAACSTHSNVEWVVTYYKPKRSSNIIINTFINMIKNLLKHLEDLQPIKGKYIMKYTNKDNEVEELVIDNPEERILYHKPNTNLYYLLTQISNKPFTIDDACSVFQMTFSSKAEHVINIMISLITDTINNIPSFNSIISDKLSILLNVKLCVDKLINNYNKTETKYKFVADTKQNKTRIEMIQNYMCLILFKIDRYYYYKSTEKHTKYFKNLLFFNSRHSNYVLYTNLKSQVETLFGVNSADAINIIKNLFFQPEILKQLVPSDYKLRKGIFLATNTLDKTNKNYGDPSYSLVSYFDFFEVPIDNETNTNYDNGQIINYDWLEYKSIDDYSTKMDLKNDIVLVECRIFQKILSVYVYNIADAELKNQMKNGACNILTNHFEEDVSSLSIANLKKIVEIYDNTRSISSNTRSNTSSNTRTIRSLSKSITSNTRSISKSIRPLSKLITSNTRSISKSIRPLSKSNTRSNSTRSNSKLNSTRSITKTNSTRSITRSNSKSNSNTKSKRSKISNKIEN